MNLNMTPSEAKGTGSLKNWSCKQCKLPVWVLRTNFRSSTRAQNSEICLLLSTEIKGVDYCLVCSTHS